MYESTITINNGRPYQLIGELIRGIIDIMTYVHNIYTCVGVTLRADQTRVKEITLLTYLVCTLYCIESNDGKS